MQHAGQSTDLRVKSFILESKDQRRNLYIELQKLNQRAARNKEFL